MPNWTKDQARAINERGGKIIVSAAAGSGKTAVLSERVIQYILNGGTVKKLLIVTFTNAAAFEMKERIKNKIKQAYVKDPSNEHLKKELSLVDVSDITTMDAFYNNLVKNNFEKLNIDRNYNILQTEEENILKKKILSDLFENSFKQNENFKKLLSFFKATDNSLISDVLLKVYDFLNTVPDYSLMIQKIINYYDGSFYKDLFFRELHEELSCIKDDYVNNTNGLYESSDKFDKAVEILNKEICYINDLIKINNFDDLSSRLRTITFDTLRAPKGMGDNNYYAKLKSLRKMFKELINKKLLEQYNMTDEIYDNDMKLCKENLTTLFDLVLEFKENLLNEKRRINSYSFSDISFFVIDLLIKDGKKTSLAEDLSKKYDEILIDEYQDTNNLQNVIFNAISNNNSNLFIVGDVKQSIYRFRSAAPYIFNNDKNNAFLDKFPKLITLSKNFRSRKEVLDFCNYVFESTMSDKIGEVDYNDSEKLYLGASFIEKDDLDTEVILIDLKEKNEEDDVKNVEKEAIVVADRIKELLDSKYMVYDNKEEKLRCIKQSDIAILLRSMSNSSYFIEALKNRNISSYAQDSTTYFDNYEVKLIINILKIIDNPYDDVALMSVMNSKSVNISLDKIADIRYKNKYDSLYKNLTSSTDEEIKAFLDDLSYLRDYSSNHEIYEILNEVYKKYDLLSITASEKQGINKEKNLIQMIKHAKDFDKDSNKSLHEFITYLEDINLNKDSLEGINPLSDKNNILITTIHKSKGLEYPVIFLSETGKKFNTKDLTNEVMINEDYGMVFNFIDKEYKLKYESIPLKVFKDLEKNKMLSEELRILYVALTRAKEKIIITGYNNNLENLVNKAASSMGDNLRISDLYLKKVNTYLEIIMPILLRHPNSKELRNLSEVDIKTFITECKLKTKILEGINVSEEEFNSTKENEKLNYDINWFNKMLNISYESENIPEYVSVSTIKQKRKYNRKPNFLNGGVSNNTVGTLYHKVLEKLDVKKYNIKELENAINDLSNNKIITNEERKMLSLEKIFAYLTSDIYELLLSSNKFYREMKIDFLIPSTYYDKSIKSGNILTSGVIDLLFIKNDEYYIIDYKTDNVDTLEELKELYKVQLDLYELAIKQKMNAKKVNKYIYSIKLNKFIKV